MPFQVWNKADKLYAPNGKEITAQEFLAKHPMFNNPSAKCVISAGVANLAFMAEMEMFKKHFKSRGVPITEDMTDDEVINAVNEWEANPPVVEEPVSAEERIAAALELGNLISM